MACWKDLNRLRVLQLASASEKGGNEGGLALCSGMAEAKITVFPYRWKSRMREADDEDEV